MKIKLLFLLSIFFICFNTHAQKIQSGLWRFELKTPYAGVPFITELRLSKNKIIGTILNGEEQIQLKNISFSNNKIIIPIQSYEISLELQVINPKYLKGNWIRHNKKPKIILPIEGSFGFSQRFQAKLETPTINLNGKWEVELLDGEGIRSPGLLILKQNSNQISGSLVTPTGDYRYMEGIVSRNEFQLASFDGMFNYLFKGLASGNNLNAELLSTYRLKIKGKKNETFELPDPYKTTQIEAPLDFNFLNLSGTRISLKDKKFLNKPVILQFFGSWCPNCIDEMNYLIPWYRENQKRGIEIIALAFERSLSERAAYIQLKKVQKNFKIPYTLLIAGSTADDKPSNKIKGLKNFISFPTTVFLNRKHQIEKIHAGFSGPSTGEFFKKWQKEFNHNVDNLLK